MPTAGSGGPDKLARLTYFGDQLVAEKSTQFALIPTWGKSALRDVVTLAGTASVDEAGGEMALTLGANGADSATVDTAERGLYVAGRAAEFGVGIRIPTAPTGSQSAEWGMFDGTNGILFGRDATGVYVREVAGGVDRAKIYQSAWNLDKLDGTGASGRTLSLSDGAIFQAVWSYYGYGPITWSVCVPTATDTMQYVEVHRAVFPGSVSVVDPSLPIRVVATNGGTASAFTVAFCGRQYSVYGDVASAHRFTSAWRASVAAAADFVPLVSARRKATFRGRTNTVDVEFDSFDVIAAADMIVQVRVGGALTDPTWAAATNVSAAETALEFDANATAIAGGEAIYTAIVAGGTGSRTAGLQRAVARVPVPALQAVTLCARTVTGAGANVTASLLRMTEGW